MKNTGFIAGLMLLAFTSFTSCEKEKINQTPTTVKAEGKLKDTPAPHVAISLTAGTFCGYMNPEAGVTAWTNDKVNAVSVTNTTHSYFPNLVYTFYKKTGNLSKNVELYQPLSNGQYASGNQLVGLAHSSLTNDAKILVIANETSSSGPSLSVNLKLNSQFNTLWNMDGTSFTMPSMYDFKTVNLGNTAGQPCTGFDTN
jgi:hypothetical protein